MKQHSIATGKRKPVNLSIDTGVVAAARAAGINLSQISEAALHKATREELGRQWQEENRPAIEGWNQWLEKNGLPYADLRVW